MIVISTDVLRVVVNDTRTVINLIDGNGARTRRVDHAAGG
jgi:hypothetical protein